MIQATDRFDGKHDARTGVQELEIPHLPDRSDIMRDYNTLTEDA